MNKSKQIEFNEKISIITMRSFFIMKAPASDTGSTVKEEEEVEGLYILNQDNFDGHVSQGYHFIKFYKPWCKHCQLMAPAWQELARAYKQHDTIKVGQVRPPKSSTN